MNINAGSQNLVNDTQPFVIFFFRKCYRLNIQIKFLRFNRQIGGAIEGRKNVLAQVRFLRKYAPVFEHAHQIVTGEQVGIRETRRIEQDYVLTVDDFSNGRDRGYYGFYARFSSLTDAGALILALCAVFR
ncbi:MAG TPA: FAD-dependent oxidoreductase [Bacilli bacterium]